MNLLIFNRTETSEKHDYTTSDILQLLKIFNFKTFNVPEMNLPASAMIGMLGAAAHTYLAVAAISGGLKTT